MKSGVQQTAKWLLALLLVLAQAAGGFSQPSVPDRVLDIFDESCAFAGCHAGTRAPRGLDLSAEDVYNQLVNVPSREVETFLRVKPGDPENSYLIKKLLGTPDIEGDRMPKDGSPLSPEEIQIIADWIRSLPATEARPETPAAKGQKVHAFAGWTLANLPTAETPDTRGFVYRISHRFRSPVSTGFAQFFGLDGGAFMMTQFGIPITRQLTVTLGRSRINATFELAAKWRLAQQRSDGSVPISLAVHAGIEWATFKELLDPANPESGNMLPLMDPERFGFFLQVPASRQLSRSLSVLLVPGILVNGNVEMPDEKPLITLGWGAKWSLNETYGLFIEAIPILSGAEGAALVGAPRLKDGKRIFNDTFSAGIEIKAGGHVFHVFVTNSAGNTTNQYLSGGNFDFAAGEFRLGFNIYRVLKYPL